MNEFLLNAKNINALYSAGSLPSCGTQWVKVSLFPLRKKAAGLFLKYAEF